MPFKSPEARKTYNREYQRKLARQYYEANREVILARQLARRRDDRAVHAQRVLLRAKHRAIKKGVPFDLTLDWVLGKWMIGECEITGTPFVFNSKRSPYQPSIDRKDPALGYTQDNCRMILWALNTAFATWGEAQTAEIMAAWLKTRA